MGMLGGLIKGLADIIYPRVCVVCKSGLKDIASIDELVCAACWQKIKKNQPPFCYSCGRHLELKGTLIKNVCPECIRRPPRFDRAFSVCRYEGVTRELIREFKYRDKDHLGLTLSRLMIDFIREYEIPIASVDWIVPVPLHKARLREREFNQAEILSGHIAREFGRGVLGDSLIRHRYTKTQTELENDARFANVKNSFSVRRGEEVAGKNILLVDDVLTTGATSSEAAAALKDAGARIVFALTLAN